MSLVNKHGGGLHYVYLMSCRDSDYYKVGISQDPCRRVDDLQPSCPLQVTLLVSNGPYPQAVAWRIEHETHRKLSKYWLHGEWFAIPTDAAAKLIEEMETM